MADNTNVFIDQWQIDQMKKIISKQEKFYWSVWVYSIGDLKFLET